MMCYVLPQAQHTPDPEISRCVLSWLVSKFGSTAIDSGFGCYVRGVSGFALLVVHLRNYSLQFTTRSDLRGS